MRGLMRPAVVVAGAAVLMGPAVEAASAAHSTWDKGPEDALRGSHIFDSGVRTFNEHPVRRHPRVVAHGAWGSWTL